MSGKLQQELKKRKPFDVLEQEVFLNVQRTADALTRDVEAMLKPAGLTATQYNVLRILRGAGPDGLLCREVGDRMVTRDPDVTRLLDRMEQRGLVTRHRGRDDRRVIRVRITDDGLGVLEKLDRSIEECHRKQLGHMGREKLAMLSALLEEARIS